MATKMSETMDRLNDFDVEINNLRGGVSELEQVVTGDLLQQLKVSNVYLRTEEYPKH